MRKLLLVPALLVLAGCIGPSKQGKEAEASVPVVDPAWCENRTCLTEQTVYFDLSTSELSAEAKARVAHVANYMKANPLVALRIEGHGDGSGTDEKNFHLGDKRAEALCEELTRSGVSSERIQTWACGKRPKNDRGYVAGAPRKYQRAEFVLLTPPQ